MSQPDFIDRRLRERFLAASDGATGGDACPTSDEIFAACQGDLSEERVAALLDHALDCAHCTEAMALAREVVSGMDEATAVPAGRVWAWVGLVAAMLLVAFVALPGFLERDDSAPADDFRAAGAEVEVTTSLADGTALFRDAFVLRWDAAAEGSYYSVEVVTEDLRLVDRVEDLTETEYRVPAEKLAALQSGTEMLWRVDVVGADGKRHESHVFRVLLGD